MMQALHRFSICINHALVVKPSGMIPWPELCNTWKCEVRLPHIAESNSLPLPSLCMRDASGCVAEAHEVELEKRIKLILSFHGEQEPHLLYLLQAASPLLAWLLVLLSGQL